MRISQHRLIKLKSYSPYSGLKESCYIAGESGLLYPGVRVENISYPLTISSIQAAICSCLANEDTPIKLFPVEMDHNVDSIDFWVEEFGLKIDNRISESSKIFNPVLFTDEPSDTASILNDLRRKAVVPNSDFPVAALLQTSGGYVPGVNVEVSSWNLGLCAERVAVCRALAHGLNEFESICVFAPKSNFCSPCGACRQVLHEFMYDKTIVLYHHDQGVTRHFVQHLLPNAIITDTLKK